MPGAPGPGPSPGLPPLSAATARAAIPTPSLRPGEFIAWIRLDRPRLALGEILASSFAIVGLVLLTAVSVGLVLGYFKSRRPDPPDSGLHLR